MGYFGRLFTFDLAGSRSNLPRLLPILVFAGCGVISTCAFFLVTHIPMLQGASDQALLVVISFAWVSIFPLWILLYLLAKMLADNIERRFGR